MTRRLILTFALALIVTPALAATAWKVDSGHSSVVFRVKHLKVSHFFGRFNKIEGELDFDPKAPEKATIKISVDAASVDTNSAGRDKHLRGPDFFAVKQFPKITFASTAVKKTGENTYDVTGDLTLHGVTKSITVKATHTGTGPGMRGETRTGFLINFTVKRSEYGMKYGVDKGVLGDEVELTIGLEAIKS